MPLLKRFKVRARAHRAWHRERENHTPQLRRTCRKTRLFKEGRRGFLYGFFSSLSAARFSGAGVGFLRRSSVKGRRYSYILLLRDFYLLRDLLPVPLSVPPRPADIRHLFIYVFPRLTFDSKFQVSSCCYDSVLDCVRDEFQRRPHCNR